MDDFKKQAAYYTIDTYVHSNMVLGLGTGSTATHALNRLAEHLQSGKLQNIIGIPTSEKISTLAESLNIPLGTLDEHPEIDLTFDGADEVDPQLNLIKGGGGALLREKIIAQASREEIIMVDSSKIVPVLGTSWAVPVEVTLFGLESHKHFLKSLGGEPVLRLTTDGSPFRTDQGNLILDTQFGEIPNPQALAEQLNGRAGIVEHGLFIGLTTKVVIADENGIREMTN